MHRALLALASALVCAHAALVHDSAMNIGLMRHLQSTGQSLENLKLPSDQWFTQTLDHFDPLNNQTFQQRYQVNSTFYKTGGPLFVLLGGEGPINGMWLAADTAIMLYAQQFNAVVVQLEHRFYGKTHPLSDLSMDSLRYLTSEQALADAAVFITSFRATLAAPAPAIVFGGSYSGALAAWFRIKYPHIAAGAIASSAPVLAKLNFLQYHEVVQESLSTTAQGPQCVSNIKQATAKLQNMAQTPAGLAQIVADFKLCQAILSDPWDIMNFFSSVASNFDGIVQYNRDNRGFEGGPAPPTIDDACRIMANGSDAYSNYIAFNNFILQTGSQSCFDVSYSEMVATLHNASWDGAGAEGGRQWTYQTCVEFAYFQTSDSPNQPFGTMFPLTFSLQQCVDIYGITSVPNVDWTNTFYGGTNIGGTNIVFPNGQIDPWHALSVLEREGPTVNAIYIGGTAHCADMYPPSSADVTGLTVARELIVNYLKGFISP